MAVRDSLSLKLEREAAISTSNHGLAGLAHDRLDVFEVDVDESVHVDDVADATHGVLQHVVGMREGGVLGDVVAHDLQQLLVEHDDERIHVRFQL